MTDQQPIGLAFGRLMCFFLVTGQVIHVNHKPLERIIIATCVITFPRCCSYMFACVCVCMCPRC